RRVPRRRAACPAGARRRPGGRAAAICAAQRGRTIACGPGGARACGRGELPRHARPPRADVAALARQAAAGVCRYAPHDATDLGGRPVVAIVSRLKDQHVVLQALSGVERGVVLACVGVEPDERLRALGEAAPGRHRVVFVPLADRALAFYHLAAVAALPSRMEGLSQALLEAMTFGLPVVASDAGGSRDLITPGETGVLVPPLDPAAWARALDRVLGDADFAGRIARAGRELVRREFTIERAAERTEAVYREAPASPSIPWGMPTLPSGSARDDQPATRTGLPPDGRRDRPAAR